MDLNLSLLPHQKQLLQCEAKNAMMLGGIGSAKTHALVLYVLKMVAEYPDANHMICANTYTQLMNATVEALVKFLNQNKIPHKLVKSTSDRYIQILDTKFYLYSLKNYEDIRGIEVGSIVADEVCFSKEEAYKVIKGRLRDTRGPLEFRGFSSPNGFNWVYDIFGLGSADSPNYAVIKAKTYDNIFLPDGYYEELLHEYGGEKNPLARQELFGEFVNLTSGSIYWGFKRDQHVKPTAMKEGEVIYVGQDFNADPMCGICLQHRGGKFYVFKENVLPDSNTYETAQYLNKIFFNNRFAVIPDSTGKARKSSAVRGATDLQILKDHGIHVMSTYNPLIRDRQNNLNMKFKQGLIQIDPSCKTLIQELETLSSRDKEGEKSHVAVALGYAIWKLAPMKKQRLRSRSTQL